MANLGEQLPHSEDTKTAIRLVTLKYLVRSESEAKGSRLAAVGIECRDKIGHPIWRKDFCDQHARPLIAKARALGIEGVWHGEPSLIATKISLW